MGIRLFNLEIEKLGSLMCVLTSMLLIGLALVALIELGEYFILKILSIF